MSQTMTIYQKSHADSHVNSTQWSPFGRCRKERRAVMAFYALSAALASVYGVGLLMDV